MNYIEMLKKVTSVSFITSIIAFSTSFLMSIFSSRDDFASYTIYVSLVGLFINILPFGLCMLLTVSRYTAELVDYFNYMSTGVLVISPLILLFMLLLVSIFGGVISNSLTKVDVGVILFITYFNTINLAVISYLRVSQYFKKYCYFFVIYTFNNTFLIFIATLLLNSFSLALYLSLFASVTLSFFSVYLGLELRSRTIAHVNLFNTERISDMTRYGAPIVLSTTAMSFLVLGDKLIFESLNESQFPKYAVASLVASTSLFLVNNFASSWGAYLSKNLAEKTVLQRRNFCLSKVRLLWLVIPFQVLILLAQFLIYLVFYESKFPNTFSTIAIISSAYAFFGCSKFFMGFMNFEKKNYHLFISSILGVLAVVLLPFFSQDVQVNDMAIMLFFGMFLQFIFCLGITKRMYGDC